MSANTLVWPFTGVRRVLSDQEYRVIATHAGSGALAASSGEIWPIEEGRKLRLKASSASAPQKSIRVEVHGQVIPDWLVPAVTSAIELLGLRQDWDSYGAPPINTTAIQRGIEILAEIMAPDSMPPTFVPTNSGGCQLEWHSQGRDVEIEISSEGCTSVFFHDRIRNAQGEGPLAMHLQTVREILREVGH